jgi:hypothetical protein
MNTTDIETGALKGVEILGEMATIAGPIVTVFNPAIGTMLQLFGPVATKFAITETQVVINLKKDITKEEMIKLLTVAKTDWNLQPFDLPKE